MAISGDLTPEQTQILIDAYERDGTLGSAREATPSIGATTVEPLILGLMRIRKAFRLAVTHEYLEPYLPRSYGQLAWEMANAAVSDFRWVVLGASVGALICGLGGTAVPIVGNVGGAAGGATLGTAIAMYWLTGVGLVTGAKFLGEALGKTSVQLEEGIQKARAGQIEQGARLLAAAIGRLLAFVVPMIILMIFAKGGKFASRLLNRPNIARYLAKLPAPIINIVRASGILGMTNEEIQAIAQLSKGKLIVVRGCNPARLRYINMGYHAKPVYVRWNTARSGRYVGQVVLSQEEALRVLSHYKGHPPGAIVQELHPSSRLLGRSNRPMMQNPDPLEGGPWLENHRLERFIDDDGAIKYRLLHPDGRPFVGDMDRVLYAELTAGGTFKPGLVSKKPDLTNDDSREIAYMNEQIFRRLSNPVSTNIIEHGYAFQNVRVDQMGKSVMGWPRRDPSGRYVFSDEPLLVACNGHVYIMGWPEFAELCRVYTNVGLKFPWQGFTVNSGSYTNIRPTGN